MRDLHRGKTFQLTAVSTRYRKSDACYALLSDLVEEETSDETLSKCRWFSRGWTLQELIAPREVHFFDHLWHERGTKTDHRAILSRITGIDTGILHLATSGYSSLGKQLSNTAVATKMRWASKRQTTRPEDGAYCLLGIFNVHMPLLYGEDSNAFRRLQEEIAKRSSDLSLFAWQADANASKYTGLFASSAGCFGLFQKPIEPFRNEFTITNTGLRAQPDDGFIIFKDEDTNEYFYGWPLLISEYRISYVVLLRLGTNRFLRTNVIHAGIISKPVDESKLTVFRYQNCYIDLDSIPHSNLVSGMRREFTRFWAEVNFETQIQVLDAVPQSNWNVMSRNIAQEPTALLLRINGQIPFNFLIFAPNWISGREFYILDFSIPIVPYILQNVHRLRGMDALGIWGLEPTTLSALSHYHSTGGILSSYLSNGQSRIQVTIERVAPLSGDHSTGETVLKHSDNHQSRLHITIERAAPLPSATNLSTCCQISVQKALSIP